MTPKIELDSKEVRKIIAKYLGIPESSVTPNRYTFSVTVSFAYKETVLKEQFKETVNDVKRWEEVYHWGFGYTRCPYCHYETPFYNPVSNSGSDLENNRRTHCPKCGKRVYSNERWIFNQPPKSGR